MGITQITIDRRVIRYNSGVLVQHMLIEHVLSFEFTLWFRLYHGWDNHWRWR